MIARTPSAYFSSGKTIVYRRASSTSWVIESMDGTKDGMCSFPDQNTQHSRFYQLQTREQMHVRTFQGAVETGHQLAEERPLRLETLIEAAQLTALLDVGQ